MGELIDLAAIREQRSQLQELTLELPAGEPEAVICMDDRNADTDAPIRLHPDNPDSPTVRYYYQIAGGGYIIGHHTALAMENRRPGSFIEQGKPIQTMSGLIGKLCVTKSRLFYFNHDEPECAALAGVKDIDTTIVEHPEDTYKSARLLKPDLSETVFEQTVASVGRILQNDAAFSGKEAVLRELERGEHHDHPIHIANLTNKPHNAASFSVDYRENQVLDVPAANEAGRASYHTTMDVLRKTAKAIGSTLPIQTEELQSICAIYTGAIHAKHLLGPDGRPLPVLRIDRAA